MPAGNAPATAQGLTDAIERLIGRDDSASFGVAVSGGPDSMALLLLAQEAYSGRVAAATVDHGLRAGSADEAAWVAQTCATIGVSHATLLPASPITGSVQAAARAARYAALEGWRRERGLDWVLTAHHADDQAETMVMRLNRSSGLAGLSGIRARQGHVLRPMLGLRRAQLSAVVEARAIACIDDPANADPRFDRSRVRGLLADGALLDVVAVAASAAHLAQEEEALEWVTAHLLHERLSSGENSLRLDMAALPLALRRRLLIAALLRLGEAEPRGEALSRAMAQLESGAQAMLGNTALSADGTTWTMRAAPPRKAATGRSI